MLQSDDWKGEHLIRSVPRAKIEAAAQEIASTAPETKASQIVSGIRALAAKGFHTSRIAEALGITIPTVSYYARRDGIDVPDGRNLRRRA
jgi:transcriptional regulator with GAF, ATPase, and Fis domain